MELLFLYEAAAEEAVFQHLFKKCFKEGERK
jgi:hypothetical protein